MVFLEIEFEVKESSFQKKSFLFTLKVIIT